MKHTPGPWHPGQGNGEGSIFTDQNTRMRMTEKGTTLYPICQVIYGWNKEEDEANAHLIASAPDLLEACKAAFERLTDNDMVALGSFGLSKQLEQAIAKAEGRN